MPSTIDMYLFRRFGLLVLQMLVMTFILVMAIDFVEGARRFASLPGYELALAALMSFLRVIGTIQFVIPFIILFATILFLLGISRRQELVIMQGAGLSTERLLLPLVCFSFFLGILNILVLNPIAVRSGFAASDIEASFSSRESGRPASLDIPWFTQSTGSGHYVIGARQQKERGLLLEDAVFILINADDVIETRIDAAAARLVDGGWRLTNAVRMGPENKPERFAELVIPSNLNPRFVEASVLSVDQWAFLDLPYAIDIARQAGRSPAPLETRFHSMLAAPVLLVAMTLIAAPLTLRFRRTGPAALVVFAGVCVGFITYVGTSIVQALGTAGLVAPAIAAWTPVIAALGFGIVWVLYQDIA